ncbi:ABC transporter ATP-binding protein [Lagierella sp.]|uniref:ABC transporter ATP-binding protein n=1 Tax=Lagierella sp. TaxID=2849657 RepID=UPI0026150F57|nr:ABC transporter ATP-binding protein [Lagierella sp.]
MMEKDLDINDNGILLDVKNLTIGIKGRKKDLILVENFSIEVRRGQVVAMAGESGCGKSMVCKGLLGILPDGIEILSGSIIYNGKEIKTEKDLKEIRGKDVNMIFQEPVSALHPLKKIGRQIGEGLKIHSKFNDQDIKNKVLQVMKSVGINNPQKRYNQYPHQLSGGLCQRVVIAMAIINNPKLIIADEPTTSLDVTVQAKILKLLKDLNREKKTSIIFVSHDLAVLSQIGERINIMYCGEIVEENSTKEIFTNPKHPYTKDLLSSIPEIGKEYLRPIRGSVPIPEEYPVLCKYKDRCEEKFCSCESIKPKLVEVKDGKVRCLKFE